MKLLLSRNQTRGKQERNEGVSLLELTQAKILTSSIFFPLDH